MTALTLEQYAGTDGKVWDLPGRPDRQRCVSSGRSASAVSLPDRECLGCLRALKGEDFYGYCSPSCRTADRYAADEYETEVAA